jgi:hypothetical protein
VVPQQFKVFVALLVVMVGLPASLFLLPLQVSVDSPVHSPVHVRLVPVRLFKVHVEQVEHSVEFVSLRRERLYLHPVQPFDLLEDQRQSLAVQLLLGNEEWFVRSDGLALLPHRHRPLFLAAEVWDDALPDHVVLADRLQSTPNEVTPNP